MLFLKRLGLLAGLVLLTASLVALLGRHRWAVATQSLHAKLRTALGTGRRPPYGQSQLTELPEPVQRYFRAVLTEGQSPVSTVFIYHTGHFNMSAEKENWKQFSSDQTVTLDPPGFVWNADVALAPLVSVRVHDAYFNQTGYLRAAILGLLPVASQDGSGEIARGELLRFLAESVWYPTVLLPGGAVSWDAIDANSARATLVDGLLSVDLVFQFGTDGLVTSVYSEGRGQIAGDTVTMVPWGATFGTYRSVSGMIIPMYGEVYWYPSGVPRCYYKATTQSARFMTDDTSIPEFE